MADCNRLWQESALDRCDYSKKCPRCDWDKTGLWIEMKVPLDRQATRVIEAVDGIPVYVREDPNVSLAKKVAEAVVQALIGLGYVFPTE